MVPRERFLGAPPWRIFAPGGAGDLETFDPASLYQDVLVVLDAARGVNNGQPSLHAAWLAAVAPRPGETAIHVGAGGGYYTAILARLVAPGGRVEAYEIDGRLAALARANLAGAGLEGLEGVTVHDGSALGRALPPADVVYVNAGLAAPDPAWLRALKAGGRLIFPWQPGGGGGVALKVERRPEGFHARALMGVSFVPCEEAGPPGLALDPAAAEAVRSLRLRADEPPDGSAVAVFGEVWFSRREPG